MSFPPFDTYDVAELIECGKSFKRKFENSPLDDSGPWSDAVIQWFRDAARQGIRVYPPQQGRRGEFIVDLCHTTYPLDTAQISQWDIRWYDFATQGCCQLKLALESEWGDGQNNDNSLRLVLDDACKLAVIRATAKVMIFALYGGDQPRRVINYLRQLRTSHRDTDPWLCIGVANDPVLPPRPRWHIECDVLE